MDKIKQIGFKAGEKQRRPVIQEDTSASKSYASIAYGISEGEIVGLIDGAKSVYLDGTPVTSVSGDINIPDVKIQERKGTNDQTHLEGFPAVVNEKQYNNIEMLQTTHFVHYINDTNLDAVGIRFTFGALQETNPDNGDVSGTTIEYAIDVQADGQGYQELLRTSIVGKYSAGYQRYHRIELPQADEGWEVRIRRITPNTTSTYIADKMYLDAVAEILDVKMRYPNTALIGLKFDSERFSNIPKVDFRMRGKIIRVPANYDPVARTYAQSGAGTTNGIWNGQFKMAYTTNPAWIFYDLVLNRRYGLGNRIDASMLDKWSLYSIAQYCDVMVPDGEGGLEPRFTCNVYINNRFEAYDCLMQLAGVFRGIMYWSGTAIIAGCDRPQDPVFTYTRANIVGEFNYSGTRTKDRHSVVMVSFDDPKNNYKTEKEVVSDRKAISEIGIRTKDLAAFACTSKGQAQRAGKWALFKEQLETRIVTFALGMDGYIAPVGRVIEIADPLLAGRAVGGRIAAVSADKTTITLDRDTEVKVGDRLVLNNEEGEQESRQVASVSGRSVTVAVAFESPAVQHVWAIDSDDLHLMRFTVISVAENRSQDSINFTVTALQHEPALHEAADYSAHIDRNTYSVIDITAQKAPAEVLISSVNRINQGIDLTDLVISWKQAENAVKYHVQWRRDDGNWIQLPLQYGNQVTIENIYHGVYEAKVVAINTVDVNSPPTSSLPTLINSKFAEPAILASLTANGILFGIELNWKFPLYGAQNAAFVEIYWALRADKEDEKLLGSYAYPTTETTLNGLGPHLTIYFRARLVDRNGVASVFTPWVSATVDANPEKLIDLISGHITESTLDQILKGKIDGAGALAGEAQSLANQAQAAAANAATKAQEAANAAVNEAIERAAAITAQDTALKADAAAKVAGLKAEIDPKITTLQNGITQVTTDYKAADTLVVGQINAYKTSNDSAVASVLQKAESAVSTGATNSSAITAINGDITALNGALSTKLDASVISGYYTKGQTDAKAAEIAAGKVEEFNANLVIGGSNLVTNSYKNFSLGDPESYALVREILADGSLKLTSNNLTVSSYLAFWVGASSSMQAMFDELVVDSPFTVTLWFKAVDPQNLPTTVPALFFDYSLGYISLNADLTQLASGKEVAYTYTRNWPGITSSIPHLLFSAASLGGGLILTKWKVEKGSRSTDWTESPQDTQNSINANSTAIQNTNAEVSRVDGVATAANNATTALSGRVSNVEGAVATKAEASALTALTTRVGNAEGVNTSQGSAITTLQNTVNHETMGLATKASTSALTATNSEVSRVNGVVTGHASQLTQLASDITTINGTLATKANASALNDIYTKTQADDKATTIAAGEVSKYDANLVIGVANLALNTGRQLNQEYWEVTTTSPLIVGKEYTLSFDYIGNVIGVVFLNSSIVKNYPAVSATTWIRASVTFVFVKNDYLGYELFPHVYGATSLRNLKLEVGNKATDWTPNDQEVQQSIKANTYAIQTTNVEVSRINGKVVATANSVSTLSSNVGLLQGSINEVRQTVTNNQESTNTLVTSLRSGMADADDVSMMMRSATTLHEDLSFKNGWNEVQVYNTNYGNGALAANFTDKLPDNPVASTRQLQFVHSGGDTTPGLGGFYQQVHSRANGVFLLKFVAKLPVGYSFDLVANPFGENSSCYFIGGNEGTGKFKTYYGVYRCGATGYFSTVGFVYVYGSHPSSGNPLIWYLASSTVYDCLDSKVAPDSVVNGIAEAKSIASTAVTKADATAVLAQNLQASLDNTNANIATNYYTRADTLSAITTATNQLSSSFDTSIKNVGVIKDTRYDNQPPLWYWTNHPHRTEKEFKNSGSLGIPQAMVDTLGVLETTVPWNDQSGGAIQQRFTWNDSADAVTRYSVSGSAWSAWTSVLNEVKNTVNRKLDASIISNYYTKAEADNVVAGKVEQFSSSVLTSNENLFKGNILHIAKTYAPGITSFNYADYWVLDIAAGNGNYIALDLGVSPETLHNNGLYYGNITVSMDYMVEAGNVEALPYMYFGHGYQTFIHSTNGPHSGAKWYRIYTTFYTDPNNLLVSPHIGVGHMSGRICIRNLKIERGDMTAYSVDVRETTQSINGIKAIKTVTIDNNGIMSGYGLISELVNGQVRSSFGVNADTFYIGSPSLDKKPFIQRNDWSVINGVWVPPGTYIDTAYIANTTIKLAQIDTASIGSLSAISANLGTMVSYADPSNVYGARTIIKGDVIEVYDNNNRLRVRLGRW